MKQQSSRKAATWEGSAFWQSAEGRIRNSVSRPINSVGTYATSNIFVVISTISDVSLTCI